jgi:hypothetical protein
MQKGSLPSLPLSIGGDLPFEQVSSLSQGAHRTTALVAALAAFFATAAALCGSQYTLNNRSYNWCCHLISSSIG